MRARWGIPPEALVLLWIGRVHPEKGLDLLLEALRDERLREVHAVLAGPVQDRRHAARIRSSVAGPDLRGRIRLLGWVDPAAKADLYALADAFVLPSRKENYGIAAAEALAAGLPLLVTETSGVAELGEELGASSCAPDPAGLADAISRIAHEPGVLDRLEGAARRARSQLTWPPLIDGLEHVYAEATAISSALG